MKSVAIGMVAIAGFAMAVQADILPLPAGTPTIFADPSWAQPIGSHQGGGLVDLGPAVYSTIPGPYSAFAAAVFDNRDDYVSTSVTPFLLDGFRFVGGISVSGGSLDFVFRDPTDTTTVSAFSVNFGTQIGAFVWTITFGLNGANDPTVLGAGVLHVQSTGGLAANAGRWFLTATPPAPGTNNLLFGTTGSPTNTSMGAFELQVPAPGSFALLGIGGLLAARRRR